MTACLVLVELDVCCVNFLRSYVSLHNLRNTSGRLLSLRQSCRSIIDSFYMENKDND